MVHEAGIRHLQGIRGGYETPTRGMRWVQGTYKAYDAGATPTRGTRQVQDTYKAYEAGMRHLQGIQGNSRNLQGV